MTLKTKNLIPVFALLATGAHAGSFEIETGPVLDGSAHTAPMLQGQVETQKLEGVGAGQPALVITLESQLLEGNASDAPALEGTADATKLEGIGKAAPLEGIGAAVMLEGVKKPTPILIKVPDPNLVPAPKPKVKTTIVLRDLGFAYDSALLDPDEYDFIGLIAAKIKERGASRISLAGHTDSRGSWEHNYKLSIARAEAVKKALVNWYGFDPSMITVAGHSYDMAEPASTEAEHTRNRRVVVHLG